MSFQAYLDTVEDKTGLTPRACDGARPRHQERAEDRLEARRLDRDPPGRLGHAVAGRQGDPAEIAARCRSAVRFTRRRRRRARPGSTRWDAVMAKYLILIYGDEQQWAARTPEQVVRLTEGHRAFRAAAGTAVLDGNELAEASTSTTLRSDP